MNRENELEGYVIANISVTKKPQYREIQIIVIDCVTGDTLYKATFRSKSRSDFAAHTTAMSMIRAYCADNDYVLHDEPTSNAQLPIVRNVPKGSRW